MIILRLIYIISLCILQVRPDDCLNNSTHLQIRVFEDLIALQRNRYYFTFGQAGFIGNDVEFRDDNISLLPKNAFVTYDSNNIRRLALNGKQIRVIEDSAFYQLDCLMILDLSNNKISALDESTFKGLDFLRELNLSTNVLHELPDEVFTHMPRLIKLTVANNKLDFLGPDSFYNLLFLEELDLSNNYIKKVPGESMQYFKSLVNLQLGSNEIEDLGVENWTEMDHLRVLNVSNNALDAFDMSVKYSFSKSLTELYLNDNYLTKLFLDVLNKRFPVLEIIDINDNFWSCNDLLLIVQKINDSRLIYAGNTRSQPNVDKIACDRPQVPKKKENVEEAIIIIQNVTTSNSTDENVKEIDPPKEDPREGDIKIFEIILLAIAIVIIVYLLVKVVINTHCFGLYRRRRGGYNEVEQILMVSRGYRST